MNIISTLEGMVFTTTTGTAQNSVGFTGNNLNFFQVITFLAILLQAFGVVLDAGLNIIFRIDGVQKIIITNEGTDISGNLSVSGALTGTSLNTNNNSNGLNVNSSSNGNSHIGAQYDTNYLTNTVGTRLRTFVNGAYTTTAEFYNTVINFNIGHTFNLIPTGTIITTVCDINSMSGYLLCNGALYNNSEYSKLRAVLGENYGGNSTQFNVPNYNGSFLRGFGIQTTWNATYASNFSTIGNRQQEDQVLTPNTPTVTNKGYFNCKGGADRSVISREIIPPLAVDSNTGIAVNVSFPRQGGENRPFNHAVKYWIRF